MSQERTKSEFRSAAIGSGTVPPTSSRPPAGRGGGESAREEPGEYPEERHAGKVGYGPAYQVGPSVLEKAHGLREQVQGKISNDSSTVQRGKDRYSGELKRRKREAEMNDADPFANPEEKKEKEQQRDVEEGEKAEKERAAVVAPGGTPSAENQRRSESQSNIKRIG
ncbi:hypothetical protein LshimejAT787_0902210 [Lyophyllum shimeji]|uniref:Uncharacterized protein n=1 Tax=Lyophyllum shimeji TaxID=47721 RepID=A0A9P3USA8_LYOSH|nr:hypothetical protein LshimejAT787_0902210 [Lyophyllum shimeji]